MVKKSGFLPAICILMLINGVIDIVAGLFAVVNGFYIMLMAFAGGGAVIGVLVFLFLLCTLAGGVAKITAAAMGMKRCAHPQKSDNSLLMGFLMISLSLSSVLVYVISCGNIGAAIVIAGLIISVLYILAAARNKRLAPSQEAPESRDSQNPLEDSWL